MTTRRLVANRKYAASLLIIAIGLVLTMPSPSRTQTALPSSLGLFRSQIAPSPACAGLLPQFSVVLAIEAVPALSHGPVACLTRGVTVSSSGEEGIMLTTAMSFMP